MLEKLEFNRISNIISQDINLRPISDLQMKDLLKQWENESKKICKVKLELFDSED